ncbi:MAG: 3-methyl-2-oxobutanoate hydroxymethyltransferase, partial [Actinomycetota bacterium]
MPDRTVSIHDLRAWKGERRWVMLTAYDYPTAQILDEAEVPIILVGDSLGQVLLGYESTVRVTMTEMLHHTKAVVRGTKRALIVGDMPFLTYATTD